MALSDPSPRPSRLTAVLAPPMPQPLRPTPGLPPIREPEPATLPIPIERAEAAPERAGVGRGRGRVRAWGHRRRTAAWRRVRVDPGRTGATALALVAIAAAVIAAAGVWSQRPQAQHVEGLPSVVALEPTATGRPDPAAVADPTAGSGSPTGPDVLSGPDGVDLPPAAGAGTASAPAAPSAPLVVSVSGKVHSPGLVEVPAGARVADALAAAGGALPGTDLSQLNLARRVSDGEQVAVGVPAAPDATAPAGGPAAAAGPAAEAGVAGGPPGRIDLNAATAAQLDGLPGIGPVTVQRILEWRTRNGRFSRVEQLREIDGIGERRFAQLRELVAV